MFADIPAWVGTDMTPWAIVTLVVLSIITGRFIVPKIYYLETKTALDKEREANASLRTSVAIFAQALPELLEVGKTTDKVWSEIKQKSAQSDDREAENA
ncbi:hypothetical protein SEA_EASTWEST_26 [Arthrobacter phage EastWest]|uniref:Uncharacterized protein n=1 Tax=Arthrobacter phage EastWest TaxID=2894292 RepID=A0AAE8YKG1_9CAUD|nr:hypothetical protein SEA_EASTWEST_26 [Arthrobacter phage EastWest]